MQVELTCSGAESFVAPRITAPPVFFPQAVSRTYALVCEHEVSVALPVDANYEVAERELAQVDSNFISVYIVS